MPIKKLTTENLSKTFFPFKKDEPCVCGGLVLFLTEKDLVQKITGPTFVFRRWIGLRSSGKIAVQNPEQIVRLDRGKYDTKWRNTDVKEF